MARKDNKGRNLKTGEYQRPDGRYEYRYKDEITGKRNSVYAADLASLREMEKKINKDMDDLLITDALVKKLTVYDAFRKQKELNLMFGLQSNVEVGGRSGFIFNTKHGRPIMPAGVNSFLKNIVNAYNKKESKLAEEEKREPELMPPISSHTLRHTGCTRLGENNVNPKVMQYVMGCWMSGGHPFSTDRSGAKNIQMHRSQ